MKLLDFIKEKLGDSKCGGRGRCSKCGETVNNVAYHESTHIKSDDAWRIKCPKCDYPLTTLVNRFTFGKRTNVCTKCGYEQSE